MLDPLIDERDRDVRGRVSRAQAERDLHPTGGGSEEERFAATLRQGLVLFEDAKGRATEGRVSGDDAFKLSDTFGFPLQLTEELAAEAGLTVDTDRFAQLLEEQRRRARDAAKKVPIGLDAGAAPPSTFVGYDTLAADATLVSLLDPEFRELHAAEEGEEVRVFLDRTPFYAEGGGQVGDRGAIRTPPGVIRVLDTVPAGDRSIVHSGVVESGEVQAGQEAHAEVDAERREATARAHTSTHVVHATLRSCSATTLGRRGRSSSRDASASTSRTLRRSRRISSSRRRSSRTAASRGTTSRTSTRPRWRRPSGSGR